jgi:1-acyl-sn-glycerol-3-phosphate acyltransferase
VIRDLVWACLVCTTEGGVDASGTCRTCGARYRRGTGAKILVKRQGARDVIYSPAEITALLPPPGTSGTAECTISDSIRDWPLYANGMYLGRIEKLGPERAGKLILDANALRFTTKDGAPFDVPLLAITAIQPSSHALQIKARGRPVFSIKFTQSSSKLWEERLQGAITAASIRAGRGPVVEFQPRICTKRIVDQDSASFRAQKLIDAGRNRRPEMPSLYRFCCWLARALWQGYGGQLTVSGLENIPPSGPFMVLPNHQSYLETMLIPAVLPRPLYAMAKSTQFNVPFFGWLMAQVYAFPVRRFEIDPQAVRFMLKRFGEGHGVMIFIEGERTWDGDVQPARLGVARAALKTGVPVIPCHVEGAFDAWPRWSGVPQRGHVRLTFGKPLELPKAASRGQREICLDESLKRIREAIAPR